MKTVPFLQRAFKKINTSFWENSTKEFQEFLAKAIDFYDINVSEFELIGDADNSCYMDPVFKILNLRPEMNINEVENRFVVLHELRHVQQYLWDWFDIREMGLGDFQAFWQGSPTNHIFEGDFLEYNLLPQELDANLFAFSSSILDEPENYHGTKPYWACRHITMREVDKR